MPIEERCTLTDEQLIETTRNMISDLAESGGRAWTMRVPVDFNRDHDMVLLEVVARFEACVKGGN